MIAYVKIVGHLKIDDDYKMTAKLYTWEWGWVGG